MRATKRSLDSGASDSSCYDRRDSTYAQGPPGSQNADKEASALKGRPSFSNLLQNCVTHLLRQGKPGLVPGFPRHANTGTPPVHILEIHTDNIAGA